MKSPNSMGSAFRATWRCIFGTDRCNSGVAAYARAYLTGRQLCWGGHRVARESPPTRRVAELLDAVIAAPGRAFSLAELAKQTGISKATCLGIVNELVDAGYLS